MATHNPSVGTKTQLTVTGLSTLASGNYCVSDAINHDTNKEPDLFVEVAVTTTNTPTGNKQVLVFAQISLDNTNWTTGPTGGTDATDEPDLYWVGSVPINSTGTHRKTFSLANCLGRLPKGTKIVIKNDLGVALTGGAVYTAPAVDTVA